MAKITETNPNGIMWLQVCSLAGMQGAITLFPQLATFSLVREIFIDAVTFLAVGTCVTASHRKRRLLEET